MGYTLRLAACEPRPHARYLVVSLPRCIVAFVSTKVAARMSPTTWDFNFIVRVRRFARGDSSKCRSAFQRLLRDSGLWILASVPFV